jgi:hypothetical protein
VVKMNNFFGGGGRKEVAICDRVIKFDCTARSPTSSIPQSNGDDMGNDNGNEVASNKEGDGKRGKSNGDGNEDGGQAMGTMVMLTARTWAMVTATRCWATKRAMGRVARVMAMAMRMAGNKEGNGKGGKGDGDGNEGGRQRQEQ